MSDTACFHRWIKALLVVMTIVQVQFSAVAEDTTYAHANEPIGTVRQVYDGKLYPDLQVNTFRNIDRLFPTRTVKRGANVSRLPVSLQSFDDFKFQSYDRMYDMYDVLSLNRVSGIVIIKDGEIRFEKYLLGNDENTRWMSMSVVKSITATLIGAAIKDDYIKNIDDPIVNYLPRFRGSAYDGVTVRQILQMTSGVAWNETYTDPASDRRRMLEAQIGQEPGEILDLMASLQRAAEPGSVWNYSTGETQVAGALVAAATGKNVADYLSEKIWSRIGMQADANWWLESPDGLEVGGSGLSATLRDYARFGLFLLNNGAIDGESILPDGWLDEASTPKIVNGERVDYGYMLWPLHGRSYSAIGIFGQFVFVDPDTNLVVAMWGAQPKPVDRYSVDEYEFFHALSEYFR
jgi:CubicO group peptidase (beta-lactamase class C family)